jgi:hypothetical protein
MADTSPSLRSQQRTVLVGAGIGVVALVVLYGGGYALLKPLSIADTIEARLALAVRCAVAPTLMLLAGIGRVANDRFASQAIDPTARKESDRMVIHGRYVDNTTQQLLLYGMASFGLALYLSFPLLRMLPVMAASFAIGRVVFWIGYLKHPLYRAPGQAMTMYPSMFALVWLAWKVANDAVR